MKQLIGFLAYGFLFLMLMIGISPTISNAYDGYCGSLNSDPGDPWCVKTSANYCCIGGGGNVE